MYGHFHDQELYDLGVVTSLAVNDPKKLRDLEPRRQMVEQMNLDQLPGMLRIPKKKTEEAGTNGR